MPINLGVAAGTSTGVLDLSTSDLLAINVRFSEVRVGWESASVPATANLLAALTALSSGGSDLAAAVVVIKSPGANNDLRFTATTAGATMNDAIVRIFDDGTLMTNTAVATWNASTKQLLVNVSLTNTTAATVLAQVNAIAGQPFLVTGTTDYTDGSGVFVTVISDKIAGGSDAVAATAQLPISGASNNLLFTATSTGSASNGWTIALVNSDVAAVTVQANGGTKVLTIQARLSDSPNGVAHTAAQIAAAVTSVAFTAAVTTDSGTSGDVELGQSVFTNPTFIFGRSIAVTGDVTVPVKAVLTALYGNITTPGTAVLTTGELMATAAGGIRLRTAVDSLTATSTANGNLVINEADSVTVKGLSTVNGHLSLFTAAGDLTVAATGTGVIAAVGDVTLQVGGSLLQNQAITTTSADKDIFAVAVTGSITMASAVLTQTAGGNIRYAAGANLNLTSLNAGAGKVSLVAGGAITDLNGAAANVTAAELRIEAGTSVGASADAFDTVVGVLAAQAGSSLFFNEADALTLGTVTVAVDYLNSSLATTTVTDASLAGLRTTSATPGQQGPIVVVTLNGTLTVSQAVNASGIGNVLLRAQTASANDKDVLVNAPVTSGTGNLTVIGNRHVTQAATGDLTTGGGTIDVEAESGSITMTDSGTDSALAVTGGGNLRYSAAVNIVLGGLDAGAGSVSLTATAGAITDGGDTSVDVRAGNLRLTAGLGRDPQPTHSTSPSRPLPRRPPAASSWRSPTTSRWAPWRACRFSAWLPPVWQWRIRRSRRRASLASRPAPRMVASCSTR